MKGKGKNFTLIELLVVIAIASLVMGLMLPAFNRMITGSAVDRQTAALKLALERAQGEAASSRRYVALILPNGAETVWTESEEKTARLGGSRMCYVDWTGNGSDLAFQSWVPNTEWTTPERGACLLRVTNISTAGNAAGFPVAGNGLAGLTAPTVALAVRSDSTSSTTAEKSLKDISGYDGGAGSRADCAIVFSPTGTMKSDTDIYLVVGETSISSGTTDAQRLLTFPVRDTTGPVNLKVLHINRLSGSVEYVQ